MTSSIPQPHGIGRRELAAGTVAFCHASPPDTIIRHTIQTLPRAGGFVIDHFGTALPTIIHELDRLNRLADLVVLSPNGSFATATFSDASGFSTELSAAPIGKLPSEIEEQLSLDLPSDPFAAHRMLSANIGRTFTAANTSRTLTETRMVSRTVRMDSSLFVPRNLTAALSANGLDVLLLNAPATHRFADTFSRGSFFVWHAPGVAASIPVGRILLRQFRATMRKRLDVAADDDRDVICFIAGAAEEYVGVDDQWLRPGALASAAVVDVLAVTRTATWNLSWDPNSSQVEAQVGLRLFCGQNPLIQFKEGKWLKRAGLPFESACGCNTVVGGDDNKGLWVRTWPNINPIEPSDLAASVRRFWNQEIQKAELVV